MLTRNDLELIRQIMREEITGIQRNVPQMIENGIKKTVPQMIEKALKPIKRDIKSLKRGQDIIISFFDRDSLELRSRVDRIERHLKLPSN